MNTPHKATAEQWARQEEFAAGSDMLRCLLELRARVQALEATQHAHVELSHLSDAEREAAMNELLRAASGELRPVDDQAVCPHIITGDEGTSYCALAEKVAAMESAAPPAGSLVERVMIAGGMGLPESARAAIRAVAVAARHRGGQPLTWEHVAQWLEQEADR